MPRCLLDYILHKEEAPKYLIFDKEFRVDCHMEGEDGHIPNEEGWGARYYENFDMDKRNP